MRLFGLTTLLLTTVTTATFADTLNYNVIDLQTEATRLVSNDEMNVRLSLEKTNKQPAELANQINSLMSQGLALAKKYPQVKVKTGNQNTYPIYDTTSRKLKDWRANAELQLTSKDFKAASQLLSELQQTFQMENISFSVSDEQRKKVESELVIEASQNFQQRAQALTQAWRKTNYELVNLNINTNNYEAAPAAMGLMMAKSRVAEAPMTQEVSSGESKITVSANGSIQLK